ncbi:neural cell adhesion molecule 2-like isoform X2 [Polyodon spathula]|nr:neural cell adhesion molecule 2-like isoform X2 [Polyodon spathula]
MLFDTWELKHTDEMKCRIANSNSDPAVNTCNDGRILISTTEGRSQLHIPSFKYTYEGIYKCQTAFQHGSHKILFNVSVIVQPEISGRIEYSPNDNHSVAVCEASSGKPKASISWTSDGNVTDKITYNQNRTFTVESRLIIPYNASMGNVTCIVSHPYWNESQTYTISLRGTETQSSPSATFSVTPSASASTKSLDYFDEEKFVSIKLGEEINLSCTNRTWSTMLFDTWELKHTDEMKCRIANSNSDPAVNTCNDGRILISTTEGRSQLHIPSFKYTYEGIYKCQTAFQHGSHKILFNVSVIVQPEISGRIEYSPNDNHSVAVCEASSGKPKASISWTSDGNVTDKITYNQNRTFTVESRLIIPYNASMGNVTCVVSHPYWNESQTYTISLRGTETQSSPSATFSVTPSASASTKSLDYFDEEKFVSIKLGEEINLSCTNRTWSTMLFDTWELKHTDEMKCRIANSNSDPAVNTCNDGRILINTTEGRSQLHIPSFKYTYEGIYKCQTAFHHGSHKILFNVSVIVQPEISGRIEYSPNDNHSVAVCEASSGKPKASISWTSDGNVTDKISYNQNRTFTVESRLIIPYNASMGNVTCIVSHPYWNESQTYTISLRGTVLGSSKESQWIVLFALIGFFPIYIVCIIVFLLKYESS